MIKHLIIAVLFLSNFCFATNTNERVLILERPCDTNLNKARALIGQKKENKFSFLSFSEFNRDKIFWTKGIGYSDLERLTVNQNRAAGGMVLKSDSLISEWQDIDVIIPLNGEKIGGSLLIPKNLRSNSLVVMSSGSGPQDRDETLFGFKIFKVIAEYLASQGIASFRYDDRGVGNSTGDFVNSTLADHTHDLEGILSYFEKHENYQFDQFTLFGHSQGGIISAKVAAEKETVNKLILMASPAVPLKEVVLAQVRLDYLSSNLEREIIEAEVSAHNRLMRALLSNQNSKEELDFYKETYKRILVKQQPELIEKESELNTAVDQKANELKVIYNLPSLKSFLQYDPVQDLEKLNIPVLALIGGNDAQVSIEQNKDRMESAFLRANTDYDLKVFNAANHLFQEAETGLRGEYENLEKEFVNGFLTSISSWLLKN